MTTDAERRQTWSIPQAGLIEYAGAARDFNAIHYDLGAARLAGFDRPIVHGMLTLGRLLVLVEDMHGIGSITSVSTRFGAPALVEDHLEAIVRNGPEGELEIAAIGPGGSSVLTGSVRLQAAGNNQDAHGVPAGAELVADRILVVERGPATRFASALAGQSAAYHSAAAAKALGYPSTPTVPTFAFALPGWGFFTDMPGNDGQEPPDIVAECQRWCRSDGFIVHATQAFTFTRPLCVGDVVRARSYVIDRRRKESPTRVLDFTDVRTHLTDLEGAHVLTSDMGLVVISPSETTRQQHQSTNSNKESP